MRDTQLENDIIKLLRERGNRLLAIGEIHERLADPEVTRDEVEVIVEELERDGVVIAVRGKRYSLLEFTPYHAGAVKVHPDGYGTVFGGAEDPDIYIDRKLMKGAMNGDFVIVRVDKRNPKFRKLHGRDLAQGEIIRILKRAHRHVVGRFHEHPTEPYVVPFDFRIPHAFPAEVIAHAESIPSEVAPGEIAKRADYREHNIVTIDGETAKDFDDAVEVARLANGNYLLGVHIADVAHYVTENSALDREAFERGTSVYFP